tara:strand:+ start:810 stop:1085 length:276 start_codon:yes stop_codon:yes gene_type:complete
MSYDDSSVTDIEDIYNQIEKITSNLIFKLQKMRNLVDFLNNKLTEAHITYNIEIITLKTENLKLKRRIRKNIRSCITDAKKILKEIQKMQK